MLPMPDMRPVPKWNGLRRLAVQSLREGFGAPGAALMASGVSKSAGSVERDPDDPGALLLFALGRTSGCAVIRQTGRRLPEERYVRFCNRTMRWLHNDDIGHVDADGHPLEREPHASVRYGHRGFVATREFKLLLWAEIYDVFVVPYLTFDETVSVAEALPGEVHRNAGLRLVKTHFHVAVSYAARMALCRAVPMAINHSGDGRPAENLFALLHQNWHGGVMARIVDSPDHFVLTYSGPRPLLGAALLARKSAALHVIVRTLGRLQVTCKTFESLWERMVRDRWPLDAARGLIRRLHARSTIVCRCKKPAPRMASTREMRTLEYWREQKRLYTCGIKARVDDVLDDRRKLLVLLELLRRGRARPSGGDASNGLLGGSSENDHNIYCDYVEIFGVESAAKTVCVAPVVDEADNYHLDLAERKFAPDGPVTNILKTRWGVGLVEFETREAAQSAVARYDGLGGATYRILEDIKRVDRQRSGAVLQLAVRGFAGSHLLRGNLKTILAFCGL
jgi:hypothetical protein